MTYLLIHGGGSTARFWDRLVAHLGSDAVAVDLPGRASRPADLATLTVDEEVASVLADVEAAMPEGPVVVVAHSSGGLVVPGVVAGLGGRVAHVVLVAALVPPEGGSGLDCMREHHAAGLKAAAAEAAKAGTPIILPGPPADPESFRRTYGGDPLDDDTLAHMVDPLRCVPDTVCHYFQAVRWSQAADVGVTYVVTGRDRPIPVALQEEMLGRLPRQPEVVRIDAGHIPPVTMPAEFAALLRDTVSRIR